VGRPFSNVTRSGLPGAARSPRFVLAFIAATAFLVRLLHVVSYEPWPTNDMAVYVDMAVRRLSLANIFTQEGLCWFPPGYAFFLKPFFLALEPMAALRAVQVVQAALSASTCILIYRLGTRIHSKRAGLVAAVLTCFYPHMVFYTSAYMSETLFIFVYFSGLLMFLRCVQNPDSRRLYLAGLVAGLSVLIRPAGITMAPVALLAAWKNAGDARGRLRAVTLVVLGGLTLIGPWTARNWIAHGHFIPISPNGPFNLAIGNQPDAKGGYTPPPHLDADIWARADHFQESAVEFVRTDPYGALFVTLSLKWNEFWSFIPPWPLFTSNPLLYFGDHFFPFVPWRFVFPAGLAGMGLLAMKRRPAWWLTHACVACHITLYLIFFGDTRFRIPMEGFFLVWSGVAVVHLITRIPRLKQARAPAWSVILGIVLAGCLLETAWAGAEARRFLARPEALIARGNHLVIPPGAERAHLMDQDEIPLDRTRARFLKLKLKAFRSGPTRDTPDNGRLKLTYRDHQGNAVPWKESLSYNIEALPPDRWVTVVLKSHIPPQARSCNVEILPLDSSPDVLVLDQLELRYARGNHLFLESIFPYLRYEE
jgi:4-amino-4-deoxy-L-arabinose transferase-like glycosyltransferase